MSAIVRLSLLFAVLLSCTYAASDSNLLLGRWRMTLPARTGPGATLTVEQQQEQTFHVVSHPATGDEAIYTVVADGQLHPDPKLKRSTSLTVLQDGSLQWRNVYNDDAKQDLTWRIVDQNHLVIEGRTFDPLGRVVNEFSDQFQREGSGSHISGKWLFEKQLHLTEQPYELIIKPYQGAGISIDSVDGLVRQDMGFDGQYYPDFSKTAKKDTVSSMKPTDSHTWEMNNKTAGIATDTETWKVAEDNQSMTITIAPIDGSKPEVYRFVRTQ